MKKKHWLFKTLLTFIILFLSVILTNVNALSKTSDETITPLMNTISDNFMSDPVIIDQPILLTQNVDYNDLIVSANINLNGYTMTVDGDFSHNSGSINFNGGQLIVNGNCSLNSYIYMRDDEDYLLVTGNFSITGGDVSWDHLTSGIIEVKGNFSQTNNGNRNYYATGTHRTIFSGTGVQEIYFANPSGGYANKFNILDLQNNTNVIFASPLYDLTLHNDLTMNQDTEITLTNGLYLKGHNLTVNGDFNCSGNISFEEGQLIVNGDFNCSSTISFEEGQLIVNGDFSHNGNINFEKGRLIVNGNCSLNSYIYMRDDEDYLLVTGNFSIRGGDAPTDHLIAGTVEVKGDFSQTNNGYRNYYATGTHRTIFSGTGVQEIYFANPTGGYANKFNILDLQNNKNIIFASTLYDLTLHNDLIMDQDTEITVAYGLNLKGHKLTINGDFNCSGTILFEEGQLIVNGDFSHNGNINFEKGRLIVNGNCSLDSCIYMHDDEDYLLVTGNFSITGWDVSWDHLTSGIVEVKGDFSQTNNRNRNYHATGTHRTIFSGTGVQEIYFANPSGVYANKFNILDLQNNTNVIFASPLYDLTLHNDLTMNQDTEITLTNGLYLKGHKLTVNGDFNYSGTISFEEGQLIVNGDFSHNGNINFEKGRLIVNGNCSLNSCIYMRDNEDYLLVTGNFSIAYGDVSTDHLTAGTIEVRGNFSQMQDNCRNYYATGTHKTILSGTGVQEIYFASPTGLYANKFNILQINKPLDEYIFNYSPCWSKLIDQSGYILGDVNGDGSVTIADVTLTYRHVRGLDKLTDKNFLAADVNKDGNISMADVTLIYQYVRGKITSFE